MKVFSLSHSAILRIIEGLALEYGKTNDRYVRSQCYETVWDETLDLGGTGLSLGDEHINAIWSLVVEFFDLNTQSLSLQNGIGTLIAEWVNVIEQTLAQHYQVYNFRPAGFGDRRDLCAHRVDNLLQEAAGAASLLQGRRRLVTLVSPHSLLGIVVTVMAPTLLDVEIVDGRKHSFEQLKDELAFGDVIVATPSLWAYLLREGLVFPDNSMGVSFGEVMTTELAVSMRRNGIGVLRELYGSTQNGLVAWRDSPNDNFILFEHWARDKNSNENFIRRNADGNFSTIQSMDFLEWHTDRTFSLLGRRDGAVQIGAVNVFPEKIAAILTQLDFVNACKVRVTGSGQGTNRLIADISLARKQQADEQVARHIDNWCRQNLAVHERPHILNFYEA